MAEGSVTERAALVDTTDRANRIEFIIGLFGADEWVGGASGTVATLAAAWGMPLDTLQRDSSDAALIVRTIADKGEMLPRFWAARTGLLERMGRLLGRCETYMDEQMRGVMKPEAFAHVVRSITAVADNVSKQLDQVGVAAGAVQTGGTTVNMLFAPGWEESPKHPREREALEAMGAASAAKDYALARLVAEVATRHAADAEELLALHRSFVEDYPGPAGGAGAPPPPGRPGGGRRG